MNLYDCSRILKFLAVLFITLKELNINLSLKKSRDPSLEKIQEQYGWMSEWT
jgi:hypothetical protein